MPSQHTADETVVQLMSSPQFLYYVTKDSAEQYMLRIAKWDGASTRLSFHPCRQQSSASIQLFPLTIRLSLMPIFRRTLK